MSILKLEILLLPVTKYAVALIIMKRYKLSLLLLLPFFLFVGAELSSVQAQTSIHSTKSCTTIVAIDTVTIEIRNHKDVRHFANYVCNAELELFKDGKSLGGVAYQNIAQEGTYGLYIHDQLIPDFVFLSKYGNAEDQTIIVNKKGRWEVLNGNLVFLDTSQQLLFVISQDLKNEVSVYNLQNEGKVEFVYSDLETIPQWISKDKKGNYWVSFFDPKSKLTTYYILDYKNKYLIKSKIKREKYYQSLIHLPYPGFPNFRCECNCEKTL